MDPGRKAYQARYVFPVVAAPLADGVVTVENGQIIGVGRQAIGCKATDLGNVAILPGLINAHTHLEFSGLAAPLGTPGMAFTDWVRLVVAYRRQLPPGTSAIVDGLSECIAHGQAALAEIATTPWGEQDAPRSLAATVFLESIGLRRELVDTRLATAKNYLGAPSTSQPWRRGLSPHAPYSVHPDLFDGLVSIAASAGAPVAFHLAESLEERRLLASGDGPLREMLVDLGAWDETALARGTRPLDYLRRLASSGVVSLIIHGNYLDDEEIDFVAANADRLTVVYCPRTHAFFGHARHPLPRLLAVGANVALGTDSRASNPDLDLLAELRYVAAHFPEVEPGTVLDLGTLRAARALRLDDQLGSIEPGKTASLAVLPLSESEPADPHWLLFESDRPAAPLL